MFCHNCGTKIADGSAFCGYCGTAQRKQEPLQQAPVQPVQETPVQPTYQAPVQPQQPVYQAPAAPVQDPRPAHKAAPALPQNPLLATIAFVLSLVLLAVSVILPLTTPFFDIPAMSFVLSMADADPDELTASMEDAKEDVEWRYELQKNFMDEDEKEAAKKLMDGMEKLTDNFSILNFNALVKATEEVGEDYMSEEDMEEMESISSIMSVVIGVVIGFFVLPLLFTLLGGLKKSSGLTIAALIFTALAQLLLSGLVMVILSLVVNIFQITGYKKLRAAR